MLDPCPLLILLSTALIPVLWTSSASSQEKQTPTPNPTPTRSCTTRQSDRWICVGDAAWQTGYLVEPGVMGRIVAMRSEHRELRLLVDRLVLERDTAIEQRDTALVAAKAREVRLYEWRQRDDDVRAWTQAQPTGDLSYTTGALIGAGGVVVGVLVAVIAGGR